MFGLANETSKYATNHDAGRSKRAKKKKKPTAADGDGAPSAVLVTPSSSSSSARSSLRSSSLRSMDSSLSSLDIPPIFDQHLTMDDDDERGARSLSSFVAQHESAASLRSNNRSRRSSLSVSSRRSSTSVADAISGAMDNEKLWDVTLIGRNHQVQVRAAKFVLASRNPGLQQRIYANGPTASQVYLGEYSQEAIEALVEFCHSGEIIRSPLRMATNVNLGVRGWAELVEMSQEYDFPDLYDEAYPVLTTAVEADQTLACSVYDYAWQYGRKEMQVYALEVIQAAPSYVLMMGQEPGVQYLSPPSLQQLLMQELYVNDMTRVLILTRWIDAVGRSPEHVKVAVHCASNIPLDNMDPNFLMSEVKDSGLFDVEALHTAAGLEPPQSPSRGHDFLSRKPGISPEPPDAYMYNPGSYIFSPATPASDGSSSKANKNKKMSKRRKDKACPVGHCFQLKEDGKVIVISTDTPNLLPDFDMTH